MSTSYDTVEYILKNLRNPTRFSTRAMFGEYALYADGKVVALICDDLLYVKIVPASITLKKYCEKDSPYPGAKPHYVISEEQYDTLPNLPAVLLKISRSLLKEKSK